MNMAKYLTVGQLQADMANFSAAESNPVKNYSSYMVQDNFKVLVCTMEGAAECW